MDSKHTATYIASMDEPAAVPHTSEATPPKPAWITSVLFTLIVSVVATAASLAWWDGANVSFACINTGIWSFQYWRLIAATLLHGNTAHLVANLTGVWLLGIPLERRFGFWRMALLYYTLAVGASATSFLCGKAGFGMSGIVYGYAGLVLAAGSSPNGPRLKYRRLLAILVFLGFLQTLVAITLYAGGEIGHAAHAAGFAIGIAMGLALRFRRPLRPLVLVGLASIGLAAATAYMPWSWRWWWHRADVLQAHGDDEGSLAAVRRAIDLAPDDDAVAPLLRRMGYAALRYRVHEEAIVWYTRAMLVAELPAHAKVELASAYYETHHDENARAMLKGLTLHDLPPSRQEDPFYRWYLDWAQTSKTEPVDTAPADSQPVDSDSQPAEPAQPAIPETIRRLLDPTPRVVHRGPSSTW